MVASSLGSRDQAIGRLIENLNTVTGAIDDRDTQIRAVLDNLVAVSQTFSQNTNVLSSAVTDLGDFSDNFGALLANNRGEIDRIIANLNALLQEVQGKLPVVNSALSGLDEGAKRLFNASRYGEWLNQTIPCGALTNTGGVQVPVNDPCLTGVGALAGGSAPQGQIKPASGPQAISQLLTEGLAR
jgi:ABC-type transporter Mla subunit MlaD